MNAVVSGTSSGIGLAVAKRFLAGGLTVYGVDWHEAVLQHPRFVHIQADIRDDRLPAIPDPEILVHSAGTIEDEDALSINLEGTIRFNERFMNSPVLRSVVFIASASARNGAEFPLYVASKAGIVGYMKNLALRLALKCAPRNVTVNSVSPGGVITPANNHILDNDELYEAVLSETLFGKWSEADEIAELVWYLTVINRSMTGEDILIDNGEMLKSNFIW